LLGVLLAHSPGTLALRLSIARIFVLFAASMAAAHPSVAQDPAAVLTRAGTVALESQRFGDALHAFSMAARMRPGDANACFGAGIAAFMLGQDELAQARFERALAINPSLVSAAEWLGNLHYKAGRVAEAIAIYEAIPSPRARELEQQLAEWRREQDLQSRFQTERTDHFIALFESVSDGPVAREVLGHLEAAHARIGKALGVYPSQKTTVVLYTRAQFDDITRLAQWSVAAYDGRIRVPLASAREEPDELDRLLSHEFAHALIDKIGGRTVPAWLNEGLATVLEPEGSKEIEALLVGTDAQPSLTTLHDGFVTLSTRDAEIAYASAARAVRRLVELRGTAGVVALLQDLSRGTPFEDAFSRRLAMRYDVFVAQVADYSTR
jgi:tetratricopeptide (TPR) repeat protein